MLHDQLGLLHSFSLDKVYFSAEQRSTDLLDATSQWSLARSRQSEHFIVYWAKGYGDLDPHSKDVPPEYQVDVDDLLTKAEKFYDTNVGKLRFAEVDSEASGLYQIQNDDFSAIHA